MTKTDLYLMENPEESFRLDVKTDPEEVRIQARLCGIGPGARVLDAGCGSGKTTSVLYELVQPGGEVVGVDFARDRLEFAREHYKDANGISFYEMDLRRDLTSLGKFDFIWMRFVLEHYLDGAVDIIRNVSSTLKPDGYICLLDLDYNCLSHYPMKAEMESVLRKLIGKMEQKHNFDPYIGRKLYTYLYDLGFNDIRVNLLPHHMIYGELKPSDDFNWIKKVEMAAVWAKGLFQDYPGGYDGFVEDFKTFFHDPRRFTYSPIMVCRGKNPGC